MRLKVDQLRRRSLIAAAIWISAEYAAAEDASGGHLISELESLSIAIPAVYCVGYLYPGDCPPTTWKLTHTRPQHDAAYFNPGLKIWYELTSGIVSPEHFGAGYSTTDQTDAIQRCLNYVCKVGGKLQFLQRFYQITKSLVIPPRSKYFSIVGIGLTRLQQNTDNEPVFRVPPGGSSHWILTGLLFVWQRNQTSSAKSAIGVLFEADSIDHSGNWNITISDCYFDNGFTAVTNSPRHGAVTTLWNFRFSDIACSERWAGPIIDIDTMGAAGQPTIVIERIYLRADSIHGAALRLLNCDSLTIRALEINRGFNPKIIIGNSRSVSIESVRVEMANANTLGWLFSFTGRGMLVRINGLVLQTITVNADSIAPSPIQVSDGPQLTVDFLTSLDTVVVKKDFAAQPLVTTDYMSRSTIGPHFISDWFTANVAER